MLFKQFYFEVHKKGLQEYLRKKSDTYVGLEDPHTGIGYLVFGILTAWNSQKGFAGISDQKE